MTIPFYLKHVHSVFIAALILFLVLELFYLICQFFFLCLSPNSEFLLLCSSFFFTVFSPFAFFIRQSLKETITSVPCAWLTCKKVLHRCTFIPARLAPGLPPLKPRLRFHRICLVVFVCFLWCPSHGFIFVFLDERSLEGTRDSGFYI